MISIMIAVKDEEKYIERCLNSLIEQDFPKDGYEILVADGGSKDRTREKVGQIAKKTENPKIILLDNPGIYPPAGWNEVVKNCNGEFVVIFGGHSTAPKDFVEKNWETWTKYSKEIDNLAGVGGRYETPSFETFTQKAGYVLLNSFFSGSSSHKRIEKPKITRTIVFGMYKKDIIEKIGGFEGSMKTGGDLEVNLRLTKNGYRILTNPDITFDYYPRTTFERLLKQVWNYGVAKGRFLRRGYFIPKALIAPLFLIYVLGLALFSGYTFYLAIIILYLLANMAFSLYNAINHRDLGLFFTLPILYSYVHISSGISVILGYLFGKKFYW
jgi:glycosyltransferase involved in cell wall biosynthesis